jgi:hypothetical protein
MAYQNNIELTNTLKEKFGLETICMNRRVNNYFQFEVYFPYKKFKYNVSIHVILNDNIFSPCISICNEHFEREKPIKESKHADLLNAIYEELSGYVKKQPEIRLELLVNDFSNQFGLIKAS